MKPFLAYLAEQEQDYEYKLCSVENIHNAEMMEKIRLALGRYGLISIEPQGVQTQVTSASGNKFDEYPFMPVFICKVVLANPLSSRAATQSVSLFTRIKDDKLKFFDKGDKIVMDGAEAEQHAHPVEVDGSAQEEVGDKRAQSLVSDLVKELEAKRDAATIEREVYEGWTASHHEVSKMLGQKVERGFYLVEHYENHEGVILGPFKKCPANYDYIGKLPTVSLTETAEDGDYTEFLVEFDETSMQADPEDAGTRDAGSSMEVKVTDQDTGKEHTVAVRATSANAARSKAVEILAARTGISKDRLMPTSPSAEEN